MDIIHETIRWMVAKSCPDGIDVPNSHWLVDENRGVSEGLPLKNNK